jgi:putative peptide zinc metalloprotease protein
MTTTAEPSASPPVEAPSGAPLGRAEGVELLGGVHGSGYKEGAALVRRGDGQMVHLGPLMYGLLECVDGRRQGGELAQALSEKLGRKVGPEHVARIAQKLAAQGLLAGTEDKAPPRRNPLLALRWKVLVTNPTLTRRLTAPFSPLFRPWFMWPVLVCFVAVLWFVLVHKGVASATSEAFNRPGLLLLVFALAVLSAGFHELGHAAAARYGGATPGGMGMGLYLVWPAFYTDVTDAYRLPRRDRLRVDLGGLYFNAVVAVVTMAVWLVVRSDALLLLIALQVLQMVKQLSPVIRADGYHILSDATGVPDLFSHMGPTMRGLLPWRRHEASALTGKARVLVTLWVLIVVPVLLSLSLSAIILLPKLATTAYDSGRHIAQAIPHDASHGDILGLLASIVRLFALALPVAGSILVTQKILRTVITKARNWSAGRPGRRAAVIAAAAAAIAAAIWAWWPAGQYQPVRPTDHGTLAAMFTTIGTPQAVDRPAAAPSARTGVASAPVRLAPGRHLAVSMIPVGGATKKHPALFIIPGQHGKPAVAVISTSTPDPSNASGGSLAQPTTPASSTSSATGSPTPATAFPFKLPAKPGPGGTQALAENTTNGGVLYDVAYSLVTVTGGAPVTNTNSAYALANCQGCTTVAVSFQVVLIVGQSRTIAPINAAGALNYNCPACTTTAVADQIVVTLKSVPSQQLLDQLEADLKQLNALPALGAGGTPAAVAAVVSTVQQEIQTQINQSGLPSNPASNTNTNTNTSANTTTTPSSTPSGQTSTSPSAGTATPSSSNQTATTTSTTPSDTTSTQTTTAPTTTTP